MRRGECRGLSKQTYEGIICLGDKRKGTEMVVHEVEKLGMKLASLAV